MRVKQEKPFASETVLCAKFIAALPETWTPYAETSGFDILLVRNSDGFQIGVQAKLKLTARALAQSLEEWGWWRNGSGPDCRAVLVPFGASVAGVGILAAHLAVTVVTVSLDRHWTEAKFQPCLPGPDRWGRQGSGEEAWHELMPEGRIELPAYVPDVAAGASAPIQLTEWKIKAIKIALIFEACGFVTRADFKALRIDPRRWIDGRWMVPCEGGFRLTNPEWMKKSHPRVYEEIRAEAPVWMPKVRAA